VGTRIGPSRFELTGIRLGVKLDYIVPVLNFAELAFILRKSGYIMDQAGPNPVYFIGTKGHVGIYIDGMKGVFGAQAENVDDVQETTNEIFSLSEEAFDVDLNKFVSFFEIEINAFYRMGKDVYTAMAKLFQDSSDMKKLKDILKGDYSQISLRMTPSAKNINSSEWYDLTIEPKVNSAGNTFVVRILSRSRQLEEMLKVAKRTEKTVDSIINKVLVK